MHLCEVAQRAACAAGEYIQSQVGQGHATENKAGGSSLAAQVVTAVDVRAQTIILEHLSESIRTYQLGLITEEAADDQSRLTQPYFWCIDPLDGTLAFTERRRGYAVSIALVSQAGVPVVGVVYVPDTGDTYSAVKGQGLQRNGEPFARAEPTGTSLHLYLDRSFLQQPYYAQVKAALGQWANQQGGSGLEINPMGEGMGAVCNALAVMQAPLAAYFKYPKAQPGGGSIWDFAATRLFFEELALPIANAQGQPLHLNDPETTFMHQVGVIYATDAVLAGEVLRLG